MEIMTFKEYHFTQLFYDNRIKHQRHKLKDVAELVQLIKEVGKKLDLLEYKEDQYKSNVCIRSSDDVDGKNIDINKGMHYLYVA
jgi:hypothetical protein